MDVGATCVALVVRRCRALPTASAATWCRLRHSRARVVPPREERSEKALAKHFLDYKRVLVAGGDGGDGLVSFLALPKNAWAGPDGGDGGHGAHVIAQADASVRSLEAVRSIYRGKPGERGGSKNCTGKCAEHLIVKVPVGTVIKDEAVASRRAARLAELREHGQMFVMARGGAGGKGNRFYLSNACRAPTAGELGASGERRSLALEMRIMADVGLVGFPNAGKSSLLRAISRARPKVAAYPFTTLRPHVGMVRYEDGVQIAVADIPGLVSGAHRNRGLGVSFLRHIERCSCLVYVIDLSEPRPREQLEQLRHELEQYKRGLSMRPHAVVGNKIDLPEARANVTELSSAAGSLPVFAVSAKEGLHVDALLEHLRSLYDAYAKYAGSM